MLIILNNATSQQSYHNLAYDLEDDSVFMLEKMLCQLLQAIS